DAGEHLAPLFIGFRDEQMDGAGAKIEAIEQDVHSKHDGHQPEPGYSHASSCVSINDNGGLRIRASSGFGSELNLAIDEEEPEDRQQSVHAHKADQCEPCIA